MADPVLTDIFRAQVRIPGRSGLPEDVYVNSWAFRNDGFTDPAASIGTVLAAFYGGMTTYLSNAVCIWQDAVARIYDLGQPVPRQPIEVPLNLTGTFASSAHPSEVCSCLSFYSDRNLPRQRGRLYLGPLGTNTATVANGRVSVSTNFLNAALAQGVNVLETSMDVTWGIVSQTDATFYPVTNIWMDDAFDTQHRRGEVAMTRVTHPPAPV